MNGWNQFKDKRLGKGKHLLYLLVAASMLFYAMPRIELGSPIDKESGFWLVWLAFAVIIMIANVHSLFFLSEEQRQSMAQLKRARAVMWERKLQMKMERRQKKLMGKQELGKVAGLRVRSGSVPGAKSGTVPETRSRTVSERKRGM